MAMFTKEEIKDGKTHYVRLWRKIVVGLDISKEDLANCFHAYTRRLGIDRPTSTSQLNNTKRAALDANGITFKMFEHLTYCVMGLRCKRITLEFEDKDGKRHIFEEKA